MFLSNTVPHYSSLTLALLKYFSVINVKVSMNVLISPCLTLELPHSIEQLDAKDIQHTVSNHRSRRS